MEELSLMYCPAVHDALPEAGVMTEHLKAICPLPVDQLFGRFALVQPPYPA